MSSKKKSHTLAEVTLQKLSHDGRGIGSLDGKTVFVAGGLPNETVRFIIKKKHAKYDEGEVTEVIKASPLRQQPECEHFNICGGCSLQHLDSISQINHKQATLSEQLQHLAGKEPENWLPPLLAEHWGYRTKARLGVKFVAGKNKVLVGFRERNSRFLANINSCKVLHPSVGEKLTTISEALYTLDCRDKIAQIEVAVDDKETALVFRHLVQLTTGDLEKIKKLASEQNFKIYLQPKGVDSIKLFYPENGNELMSYSLSDYHLELAFHPSQFTQVNQPINALLIRAVIKLLELEPHDQVLDLFCGIGNFTLPLATECETVVGVEGAQSAVEQAIANAEANKISNAKFYYDNLFESPFNPEWAKKKYTKLLLDPPRSGAAEVINWLEEWQPKRIVYVSCNTATFARDVKSITNKGYRLSCTGVADMFPHTQHVESIGLFIRKG